jgi:thiamine pyrophosphokinase
MMDHYLYSLAQKIENKIVDCKTKFEIIYTSLTISNTSKESDTLKEKLRLQFSIFPEEVENAYYQFIIWDNNRPIFERGKNYSKFLNLVEQLELALSGCKYQISN